MKTSKVTSPRTNVSFWYAEEVVEAGFAPVVGRGKTKEGAILDLEKRKAFVYEAA